MSKTIKQMLLEYINDNDSYEENITLKEIVEQWLEDNNYDGLCLIDKGSFECGCSWRQESIPNCEEGLPNHCRAGFLCPVKDCAYYGECMVNTKGNKKKCEEFTKSINEK